MMPASRRGVLGGLAALSAPVLPAVATSTANPDADLIRDCARFLFLDERVNSYALPHPEPEKADEETAEWDGLEAVLAEAEPATREGWTALARVAILCGEALDESWDGFSTGLAFGVLIEMVGPEVAEEANRRRTARNARVEASWPATSSAAETPPPKSREDKMAALQNAIDFVERKLPDMRAELAALEAGA